MELEAIDSNTVLMLWDSPSELSDYVDGYIIDWSVDSVWQERINVSAIDVHVFTELTSQQNLSAAVYALIHPKNTVNFEYFGSRSDFQSVTTPSGTG